ncbi:MAG: hypothetical protein H0U69_10805 [Trueperaceae bacterium]|nr:hypothetical protein [Trueperaceae bacterium]
MWVPRRIDAIECGASPLVIQGGEAFGVPFLIDALRVRHRVAWFTLPARLHDDAVGQGNALAAAINRALDAPFLHQALPYRSHLQMLRRHHQDLKPLWIVATAQRVDAPFVRELLALGTTGYRVVLDVGDADLDGIGDLMHTTISRDALRVSSDEAARIAPAGLAQYVVAELFAASDGRFTDFVSAAYRRAHLPPLQVPSPDGLMALPTDAALVEPAVAVLALQRDGAYLEALELAVLRVPETVEDLLRTAGPAYQESGLLRRLHLLLTALPEPYATRGRVLEWRLVAAAGTGQLADVVADVDAHLDSFEAPDLRARRAGSLTRSAGFLLAARALDAKRTPLTLWQYGRLHPDPEVAIGVLRESVQVAEDVGTPYDRARNAGTLAARLLHRGEFVRAGAWARWALDTFDQHHLRDGERRLVIFNDLAVARIFSGDVVGLRHGLEDARAALEATDSLTSGFFRSTLAYLEFASDRPEAALDLHRESHRRSPRTTRSRYAYQFVRALVEFGRIDEAVRIADEALELSGTDARHRRLAGLLARGMVRAIAGRDGATDDLFDVMHAADLPAEHRISAALYYLLASDGAGHHVPHGLATIMSRLDPMALKVLSGPASRFQEIWDGLARQEPGIRLEFLGGVGCRLDGARVSLPPRLAEVALALVLHPNGVTRDGLNAFLTPEGKPPYSNGSIRALITRLRGVLPVTEAPYRLAVPFVADIVEVQEHLAAGRVREAIALMRGPLVPESGAPGVEEQRADLEETLRQAALVGGDPDSLYDLAERFGHDLEVWEATVAALTPGDPRAALAMARVRRLGAEFAMRSR